MAQELHCLVGEGHSLSKWCLKCSLAYMLWWRLWGSQILLRWSRGGADRSQGKAQEWVITSLSPLNHLQLSKRACPRVFSKIADCILLLCFPSSGMFACKHVCRSGLRVEHRAPCGWEGASEGHLTQPPPRWAGEPTGDRKQVLILPLNSTIGNQPAIKLLNLPELENKILSF